MSKVTLPVGMNMWELICAATGLTEAAARRRRQTTAGRAVRAILPMSQEEVLIWIYNKTESK